MDTIAKDFDSILCLFQKDKTEIEQVVAANPASFLARVLQLKNESEYSEGIVEKIRNTALYAGDSRWFEFLVGQLTAKQVETEVTDHFAVTIPDTEPQLVHESLLGSNHNDVTQEDDRESVIQEDRPQPELIEESQNATTVESANKEPVNAIAEVVNGESENPTVEDESQAPQIEEQELQSIEGYSEEAHQENEAVNPPVSIEHVEGLNPVASEGQDHQLSFEPLHTIDYFASQGIKLSEADLANDRLGQQVKSFTGWLKSMKKLHPGKMPEQDEVIQQIIQNAAEVSNVESDVLTEAMAEVLVKQNKKEKAVEMYEKLSLMNPSKSAYFAAKIESLKAY